VKTEVPLAKDVALTLP